MEIQRNALCICYDRYLPDADPGVGLGRVERLALVTQKMWAPGDTLTVSFMGGTSIQRQHAIDAAKRLSEIANINFEFLSSGAGTIRIAFNPSLGAWSFIGRDILGVPKAQPTMNLGFDQPGTYTHELLHSVGAIHEHQSPFGNKIQWNKPQVYHDLGGPPNNWDKATIDHNMFAKYSETQLNGTQFDPKSIMLYAFPPSWTIDGFHVEPNVALSPLDVEWLAKAYPGRTQPPIEPVKPQPPTTGGKLMGILKVVRQVLAMGAQIAKFTQTTADDNIIAGLIELIDLYESGIVTDKKAAANVIVARMF